MHNNTSKVVVDDQLYNQAVYLIRKRENPERVRMLLIERGLDEEDAYIILNDIINSVDKENMKIAKRNIFLGFLICAIGVFVTIMAHNVFTSLFILAGIAQFIIGLTQLPNSKNLD
jgi:Flp pilus assembly CpaE family ATPase